LGGKKTKKISFSSIREWPKYASQEKKIIVHFSKN